MKTFIQIKELLGSDHFFSSDYFSEGERRGTFIASHLPMGVFVPLDQDELIKGIAIFAEHQIRYYLVSCGKNWGFGGKLPHDANLVCIDLHKLNRVLRYDASLGFMRVEPGVTFQQAYDYLAEKNSPYMLSIIGGSPESSLLANAVCRGDGAGLYGNRFFYSYNYKILKPNGLVVQLGSISNGCHLLSHQCAGPFEQGLYSQSDEGIVLEIDIALAYKPTHFSLTSFSFSHEALANFLLKIKKAKNDGLIRSTFAIWNSHKAIAKIDVSHENLNQGQSVSLNMREEHGIGDWNGQIGIESNNEMIGKEQQKALKEMLLGEAKIEQEFFSHNPKDYDFLKDSPYYGVPVTENLTSAYWGVRPRLRKGLDLDADGVGFIWKCFLASINNPRLSEDIREIEELSLKNGFSPQIAFLFVEDHVVNVLFSLSFDRLNQKESELANSLFAMLSSQLEKKSYVLFRKGILEKD